jgi:hypothetical protein
VTFAVWVLNEIRNVPCCIPCDHDRPGLDGAVRRKRVASRPDYQRGELLAGATARPRCDGVTFMFPTAPPGIHYLTKHATAPTGRTKIVAKFTITGDVGTTFKEIDCDQATNPNCTPGPGKVRLYLERRGMTFDWRPYRFWSPPVALAISDYSVELPLDPANGLPSTANRMPPAYRPHWMS